MPLVKLRKQLLSLCFGEIVASIVFILCLFSLKHNVGLNIDVIILFPFCILIFLLVQGSYYWFYSLRKISNKNINVYWFKRIYRGLKVFNFILLLIYPAIVCLKFYSDNPRVIDKEVILAAFIYFFSILEYINYFYVRLSYSKPGDIIVLLKLKKIEKSSLNKELSR